MFPRRIAGQVRFLCKTMMCVTCFLTLYFLFNITVFQQSFYIITQNSSSLEQNDTGFHKHSDYMFDINAAAHLPEVKNLSSKSTLHVLPDKNNYTDQMERFYRLKPSKVNPFKHTFVISGDGICDSDTYMVTLVHSWHKYTDRRKAIRTTWGSAASGQGWPHANVTSKLKLAFIFGTHPQRDMNALIAMEHHEHQDIIQGSFVEDYKNMTLKSLLGLKWVATRCPQAKFFLKSDDDMMIDIPSLIDSLNFTVLKRTIVGPYCPHSKVFRRGKWGLTMEQYPFTFYPPYFAGSSYVFTTDLLVDLYEAAEYVPAFHIDDVYITGVLGKILNVTMASRSGFAYGNSKSPSTCQFIQQEMVAATRMTPAKLYTMWKDLQNGAAEKCLAKTT